MVSGSIEGTSAMQGLGPRRWGCTCIARSVQHKLACICGGYCHAGCGAALHAACPCPGLLLCMQTVWQGGALQLSWSMACRI